MSIKQRLLVHISDYVSVVQVLLQGFSNNSDDIDSHISRLIAVDTKLHETVSQCEL